MKHKTLICMHNAIYYGRNEFKFQKTDINLITKVSVMQPETNHYHQTVLFGPYLQKRHILSMFLGFCSEVVEVSILLGYDTEHWVIGPNISRWCSGLEMLGTN
jgi:hypothetical protein